MYGPLLIVFNALFQHIVYGSWWVALCAAAMGLLSWYELTGMWWNTPLFIFLVGATLVVYNVNMLSGLAELRHMQTSSERHHWCMKNERTMKLTTAMGLLLAGGTIWFLNDVIWFLLLPLALVALAYTVPIFRKEATAIRIREIGLWKIFLIAAVWAGMTVILPAVQLYGFNQVWELISWQLALGRFVFILAITIPFDIRDLSSDAQKGIRTIPSVMGWQRSVVAAQLLLVVFIGLVCMRLGTDHPYFIGYLASATVTSAVVSMATPHRHDYYCSFWLEGTMLLQFLCVVFWLH